MLDNGGWEVTEIGQAKFDGEVTDPLVFLGDPLLPAIGTAHPENSLLYLKSVPNGVPPIKGALNCINFTLVYSTLVLSAADKHDPERYVDSTRATKSWSHRVVQEPVEKAYVSDDEGVTFSPDEEPIANKLNDLFVPGITRNRYMPLCHYSRNELVVPTGVLALPGYVNNDVFTLDGVSVPIGYALIVAAPVSALKRFETYSFRTVDYEILINTKGWDDRLLNAGFYCLNMLTDVKERCKEKNGLADETGDERPLVNSEEPVALDIDGYDRRQIEDPPAPFIPDTFVPHYRYFRHLTRTSFTALGFT
jgi:hypothetical protein